jgi:Undecaprenyl-phosphate glucose phosphotransferase
MPSVAEFHSAVDLAAAPIFGIDDAAGQTAPNRHPLAMRTLALIGLDAGVTACIASLCYVSINPARPLSAPAVTIPLACLVACLTLSFYQRGLYRPTSVSSRQLDARTLAAAWIQALACGTLLAVCIESVSVSLGVTLLAGITETLARPWLPALLGTGFIALLLARFIRLHAKGEPLPLNRTVIIGQRDLIDDLLARIGNGHQPAFDVVGVVEHAAETNHTPPTLGGIDTLERMIRQDRVETVIVALPSAVRQSAQAIIHRFSMAPIDVYIYSGTKIAAANQRTGATEPPLLMASNRPIIGWRARVKRAEDIVLSLAILTAVAPVMLAIAAAIRITSRGSVLFRERRVGYNNHVIEVLKFRSMFIRQADADAVQQGLRGDKRVTPLGAWLRRTGLDELPQLLNVLRGDMSLVGPRPHALAPTEGGQALEEAVPVYASRHRVKSGITGWAQVNGHRDTRDSVEKIIHRVNHDLYYIKNWSLGLDIKILWRTLRIVFADDNAF